jgi:hypothetical protein
MDTDTSRLEVRQWIRNNPWWGDQRRFKGIAIRKGRKNKTKEE